MSLSFNQDVYGVFGGIVVSAMETQKKWRTKKVNIGDRIGRVLLKKIAGIGHCCEDCGSEEELEMVKLGGYFGPRYKLLCHSCAIRERMMDAVVKY